jgi:hypothetical protein
VWERERKLREEESSCREEQGLGGGFIEEREGEEGSAGVGRMVAKVFKAIDGIHGAWMEGERKGNWSIEAPWRRTAWGTTVGGVGVARHQARAGHVVLVRRSVGGGLAR